MPSRFIPSTGAVKEPVCSRAAEHSKKAASCHGAGLINSPFLTKEQVAELLGCTVRYIERQIRLGKLRACKPSGKFVRIFRKDVDAFLLNYASIGGAE